jgi:hypothetical protein
VFGPTPVEEGLVRAVELSEEAGESMLLQAGATAMRGRLLSMQGDIQLARELQDAARKTYADAGMTVTAASVALHRSWIEERAGDLEAKEAVLRESIAVLERMDERAFRGTLCADLAHCLYLQGRVGEIPELLDVVRTTSTPDDVVNFVYLDSLEGALHASEDRLTEAEAAGRRALEMAEATDYFFARAWVRLMLAATLAKSDRSAEARALAAESLAILDAKGDLTCAARYREHLDRLGIETSVA